MEKTNVKLTVYGAEQICASCVGAPGSKDTYEWLQAAIGRKYIDDPIQYEYIDMNNPPNVEKHQKFVERMIEDDLFYTLVIVNDEIDAVGISLLISILHVLVKHGIVLLAYNEKMSECNNIMLYNS